MVRPLRSFLCRSCSQLVFFENSRCLNCGSGLGFDVELRELITLPEGSDRPRCTNAAIAGCNWLVEREGELCFACSLTRTRPADEDLPGLEAFAEAEAAKRHLTFELLELGLPVEGPDRREGGLAFDLLSSAVEPVTTGHMNGVITIDLAESDDAHRERMRQELGEPYRTLLGHFRHEVGHYYFGVLADDDAKLARCRELFGDDRDDYAAALGRHYAEGPPEEWREEFVSAYAAMHPMEDWAESFAHYLHIRDSLQTAAAHGVRVRGADPGGGLRSEPTEEHPVVGREPFEAILDQWLPLTYALNAINRSMGRDDLYPFVLAPRPTEKLALVHELVGEIRRSDRRG